MLMICARTGLRNYLDHALPILGEKGKLDTALDSIVKRCDRPAWGDNWTAYMDDLLGEDSNGIYSIMDDHSLTVDCGCDGDDLASDGTTFVDHADERGIIHAHCRCCGVKVRSEDWGRGPWLLDE